MRKTALISFALSLLVFSGIFGASNILLPKAEKKVVEEVKAEDLGEGNVIEPLVEDELLFLVAGMDVAEDQVWPRTDTLILVHVDLVKGKINLISIPRDTRVFIDEDHGNDKVNHAHAFGGMTLTMRTIRDFLGIDLDYYAIVSYESVTRIVDALGGVDVNIPVPMYSGMRTLEPGMQRLDGEHALMAARFRAGYEDGDLGRVSMQQQLIVQIVKEMLKPRNIVRLPQLLDIYHDEVQTNLSLGKMSELIPLAGNFSGDGITKDRIPGEITSINGISYYEYDWEGTQAIVDKYLSDYKIAPVPQLNGDYDLYPDTYEDYEYEDDYAPVYEQPAYTEPYYEEPAYEEPAYTEPYYEEPAYEEPPADTEPEPVVTTEESTE